MLGNAQPTPYDLRFSLFGIPTRVHPLFWVISAVMGWSEDLNLTLIWIACVFVSILVHELGHALVAKRFGWPPEIVLHAMGGYATFAPTWGYSIQRSIAVSFAGPGAGFILYGLIEAILKTLLITGTRLSYYSAVTFQNLEFINLWWGLVNLLPVHPLDGGHISRDLFSYWQGFRGLASSLQLSLITAVGVALYAYSIGDNYVAVMFGVFAAYSYQALQQDRF
jgi:Zn-dependent protease